MSNSPVPIGVTASFKDVGINVATANFTFDEGFAVVTFQPRDPNNTGLAYLYDSDSNLILTFDREGYQTHAVPAGGKTYYFKASLGANMLAMTRPSLWR